MNPVVDFVGVGPMRTGTTWLADILSRHAQIGLPKASKESYYFDRYWSRGSDWYLARFGENLALDCVGEFGSSYFDNPVVPKRLQDHNDAMKIIVTLRSPVDRSISHYRHLLSRGRVRGGFWEAVSRESRIVTASYYGRHLSRWLSHYPEDALCLLVSEELWSNPRACLERVCRFLGVAPHAEWIETATEEGGSHYSAQGSRASPLSTAVDRVSWWLRDRGAEAVIQLGRRLGAGRVFRSETDPVDIGEGVSAVLRDAFSEDVHFVEVLLDRRLDVWRDRVLR